MSRRRLTLGLILVLPALSAAPLDAAAPEPADAPAELAARIDARLRAACAEAKVPVAPPVDDATFLRRLTLDLAGRIPTPQEVYAFEADRGAGKRTRAVERLLASPGYARHWANVWRHTLLPQADTPQFARLARPFEAWLARELSANRSYERLCQALLMPGGPGDEGLAPAQAFRAVSQGKPEVLAANTARVFLGVNLDCAQCHNHPFARWTKEQFWDFAAFFAAPRPALANQPLRFELAVPESRKIARAKLFIGAQPAWPQPLRHDSGQRVLARWITDRRNPFFARNAVNHVWAELFGRGLVEPLDDLSDSNPASHPKVLEQLADAFVATDYDLKYLLRVLTATAAYQRSSSGAGTPPDPRWFARMAVRGLRGEALYDSVRLAAGLSPDTAGPTAMAEGMMRRSPRAAFLSQFQADRHATAPRSVLQALELMNGALTGTAATAKVVQAAAEAPFLDAPGRVDTVFLAVLSRRPRTEEAAQWVPRVDVTDSLDRRLALADLFWVLVNSAEFSVNH